MQENYVVLNLDEIHVDPNQPRKNFPARDIEKLARSINAVGQLNPIIVNPNENGYVLEDGQMRIHAHHKLGKKTINAIVRERDGNGEKFLDQTVVNYVRFGMGIVDTAKAFKKSIEEDGMSLYQVAEANGKTEKSVEKDISLLDLPTKCHEALDSGRLTKAVAYKLAEMSKDFPPKGDGSIEEAFEKTLSAKDVNQALKRLDAWSQKTKGESTDTEKAKDNGDHKDRKKARKTLSSFLTAVEKMQKNLEDPEFMQNACMGMQEMKNYMELLEKTVETTFDCGKKIKDGIEIYKANTV